MMESSKEMFNISRSDFSEWVKKIDKMSDQEINKHLEKELSNYKQASIV